MRLPTRIFGYLFQALDPRIWPPVYFAIKFRTILYIAKHLGLETALLQPSGPRLDGHTGSVTDHQIVSDRYSPPTY